MEVLSYAVWLVAVAVASYWGARLGSRPMSAKDAAEITDLNLAVEDLKTIRAALEEGGYDLSDEAIEAIKRDRQQAHEWAERIRLQMSATAGARRDLHDAVRLYRNHNWSAEYVRTMDEVLQHEFDHAGIDYPGAAELCPEAVPIIAASDPG